ncbi:NAD(P)/FAD-dependent oxidoreductase [Paenibacillus sp. UMB4589-SE434]|uniref:NAD(P)/FAD-dependent oxidoreductase n=1 Tax=Paenibacillus sp. UMB4589-SE434 TaxID=3046314 RepID=UPI002550C4B8|nr:NAD(P)/FAD-dependent oxidoreductase [Paenibacillus sp. UMB4589-SE434]MDK8180110.1 NAD(P)/FAD-dependent oxidoreductase [Paenibacillus sp. UMB4589-SE434]
MAKKLDLYDVTIIGGGPAGLYAAFYSGMRDMKTKLIEAREELGGRTLMYPEKIVWDVGGLAPVRAAQLTQVMTQQAQTFDPTIVLGQQITGLERMADGTMLITSATGEQHWSRTLILAVGHGALKLARLDLPGAENYEKANLHYTVTELASFRGKRVLISGGGDSAIDWANSLVEIAASVTLVHRREHFGGLEQNVKQMRASNVQVLTPYVITDLYGNGKRLDAVSIAPLNEDGEWTKETGLKRLAVDAVLINHGLRGDLGPMLNWGLAREDWNFKADEKLATNLPGVFVAGDTANYGSKLYLIAGAFTDAALAVNSAKLYIEPNAPTRAQVSSNNSKFDEMNRALELVEDCS